MFFRRLNLNISHLLRRRGVAAVILLGWLIAAPAPSEEACRLAEAVGWQVTVAEGVSWLVDPCGAPFFSLGVNVVSGGGPRRDVEGRIHYYWPEYYPTFDAWAHETGERLRAWGFNTLGGWSVTPQQLNLPATIELSVGRRANFFWNDPFNPTEQTALRAAIRESVEPWRGSAYRIGYFSDNEIGWWKGHMFNWYLASPSENHSKRRLVALLRAHYRDSWSEFLHDFVPPDGVNSFEELTASRTPTRLRPGGEGIQAVRRWTGEVAQQYYRIVAEETRGADPGALVFGDRLPIYYDTAAVRAMAPYVDAIAMNFNAEGTDGWVPRFFFDGLRQLSDGKPVLVTEWFFAANENRSGNLNRQGVPNVHVQTPLSSNINNRNAQLMTVETQAERAAGAATLARRLAAQPNVVGMHWFQYFDEPRGGRDDGEDYNFGLVDIYDQPYEGLTDTFSKLNPVLTQLHRQGIERQDSRVIPYAAVNAVDNSLIEWPKDEAVLWPLLTQPGEVAFGDVYVAWDEHGLSIATITMDNFEPNLLAYKGGFPSSEAFRIDLGIDAGAGPRHFRLQVEPLPTTGVNNNSEFRARFCMGPTVCSTLLGAEVTYFGVAWDRPRVILEAKLPWSALGADRPPSNVKADVAVTAFYRSRWMSLSGLPPAQGMADPARWMLLPLSRR